MDMMRELSTDVTLESFHVERVLDDFEEAWRRERKPDLSEYLSALPVGSANPTLRRQLLAELVMVDLWHRWNQTGGHGQTTADGLPSRPAVEDYLRRYPELGTSDDVPLEVVGE